LIDQLLIDQLQVACSPSCGFQSMLLLCGVISDIITLEVERLTFAGSNRSASRLLWQCWRLLWLSATP
jgi:hypothetical protein